MIVRDQIQSPILQNDGGFQRRSGELFDGGQQGRTAPLGQIIDRYTSVLVEDSREFAEERFQFLPCRTGRFTVVFLQSLGLLVEIGNPALDLSWRIL